MKQPLKRAAYAGIISLVLSLFLFILDLIPGVSLTIINIISQILLIFISFLAVVVYSGYFFLAKKYNARLLKVMTIIGVVITILFLALILFGNLFSSMEQVSAETSDLASIQALFNSDNANTLPELSQGELTALYIFLLIIFVIVSCLIGTYFVLFGFGLLKLKDDIKYSKHAAITYIVGGFTTIILIGYLIFFLARIFEIMMFFKASEKLEKTKKHRR